MQHLRVIAPRFGAPEDVLEFGNVSTSQLGRGDVLVALEAAAVNPSDLLAIRGVYSARTALPFAPGFEGVGTVVATGRDVHNFRAGDLVLPLRGEGTWQEYIVSPAAYCVHVPSPWTAVEAAQLYINPLTAWLILNEAVPDVRGEWIALNAANSAMGRLLIQFAVQRGARPIAIVRGDRDFASLTKLGATHLFDNERESVRSSVLRCTMGRGVIVALDAIGGNEGAELSRTLAPGGIMIHYGLLSGVPLPRWVKARSFWLRQWVYRTEIEPWQQTFRRLFADLERSAILMREARAYPLHRIREAVGHAEKRSRNDKAVLVPDSHARLLSPGCVVGKGRSVDTTP